MRSFDERREAYNGIRAAAATILQIPRGAIEELLRATEQDPALVGRLNPLSVDTDVARRAGVRMLQATLRYQAELVEAQTTVRRSMGQVSS